MIIEIQGVGEERMKKIEEVILPKLGLVNITKEKGFDRKIRLSADTGEAEWANTHRSVWGRSGDDILVFLREPGELCLTMEGSLQWIPYILGQFLGAEIIKGGAQVINFIYEESLKKEV